MPPPPPELSEDLVVEILLRVPPDDPAILFRASLVCKSWRRFLIDPAFLVRYRAFHRTPPMLGFFHHWEPNQAQFVPTTSFPPCKPDREHCVVLDCRHGRVLLYNMSSETLEFIVWDPITHEERHVPSGTDIKYLNKNYVLATGAVFCASADCDHGDCHGGPFFVVLIDVDDDDNGGWFPRACVYSSETGEWSAPYSSSMVFEDWFYISKLQKALIGDVMYLSSREGTFIMRFDFCGEGDLAVANGPSDNIELAVLTSGVDGDLRLAGLMTGDRLSVWSLETIDDGVAGWTQVAVIHLNTLPPIAASNGLPYLIGSAKDRDSDVLFVSTNVDIFAIELESRKAKKVWANMDGRGYNYLYNFFPYASFITPGNHPPSS